MNEVLRIAQSSTGPLYILALSISAGIILGVIKVLPAVLERLNERRRDRASESAGDWTRLRDEIGRLSERVHNLEDACDELSHKVRACEEREATWMQRAIKAESLLLGQGEVRQSAAVATAEIRLDAADKADKERKAAKP